MDACMHPGFRTEARDPLSVQAVGSRPSHARGAFSDYSGRSTMRTPLSRIASAVSAAYLITTACVLVALTSSRIAASTSPSCPGPEVCGSSCVLDPYDVPIHCSNGQCLCPPGYETLQGSPVVCQPIQPQFFGSASTTTGDPNRFAVCPGSCTSAPWGSLGGINNPFDLVAVHGTSPGGEAFMPVWGEQVNKCSVHG